MNLCDLAKYVDWTQNWLVLLGILIYLTHIDLIDLITRWLLVKKNSGVLLKAIIDPLYAWLNYPFKLVCKFLLD